MKLHRREFLALCASPALMGGGEVAVLRPEDFGAGGDGTTNDTAAFARMSSELNRRGGGTIALKAGHTYVVGEQKRGREGWKPQPIIELSGLNAPLAILGNGARLLAQPGLRFGTFDLNSGEPVHHALPYVNPVDLAVAYLGMVVVRNCAAPILIRDLELDGNMGQLRIGGQYGDTGWQVSATGLLLSGNHADVTIENIHSHHHGQDGAIIIGDPGRTGTARISGLVSRYNGRQGLSLTGGRGYEFVDCEFSHNARSIVKSGPAAGVDVEAEDTPVDGISFARCKFIDNGGCGMVADSGDSRDLHFSDCRFIGTTSWSAWPNKPGCSFERCTFVGSLAHAYPDPNPARAARFVACSFTDDPKLSPTGKVYVGDGPIVNLARSDNVLFDQCTFKLVGSGTLPWSWKAIYRDCRMSQASNKTATPKGRYVGRTAIFGNVDLYGSMIDGTVILNGHELARGPIGVPAW